MNSRWQEQAWPGVLTVLVHVALALYLYFGLSWKMSPQQPLTVELWSARPSVRSQPAPDTPPPPPPTPRREVARPEPQPEPERAADIQVQHRAPKKIPKKITPPPEPKPEPAPKAKPVAPPPKVEPKRVPEPAPKTESNYDDMLKAIEAKVSERTQKQVTDAKANTASAGNPDASHMAWLGEYKAKVEKVVRGNMKLPPDLVGNPSAEIEVVLLPSMEILSYKIKKRSGNVAYDEAVERALAKTQALPPLPDPSYFRVVREMQFRFRAHD